MDYLEEMETVLFLAEYEVGDALSDETGPVVNGDGPQAVPGGTKPLLHPLPSGNDDSLPPQFRYHLPDVAVV